MLKGDNGILNQASKTKYLTIIRAFDEQTKLAQMSVKSKIDVDRVTTSGYIATTQKNIEILAKQVASELGVAAIKGGEKEKINKEGYTVVYYTDILGNEQTDGDCYIVIWYTDNSMRSTMERNDVIKKYNLIDIASNKSVNQATLVAAIHIENYNSKLSNSGLTSITDVAGENGDIEKTTFAETTLNNKIGFSQSTEETEAQKAEKEKKLAEMAANTGNPTQSKNLNSNFFKSFSGGNSSSVQGIKKVKNLPSNPATMVKAIISGDSITYMWLEDEILCWWTKDNAPTFPSNCQGLFSGFSNLKSIEGLKEWDTSGVTNTRQMFFNCSSLENLNGLEEWNLTNNNNTFEMFTGCSKIESLEPLKNWEFSSVKNMDHAFMNCSSLKSLKGVEEWNVSNVTSMQTLFGNCSALEDISSLAKWKDKVTNVKDMAGMFQNDQKLTTIDGLNNWKTESLESTKQMFQQCYILTDISALQKWDMSKNKDMERMFYRCNKLSNIDGVSEWQTSNLESLLNTFAQVKMTNLNALANWNVSKVKNFASAFDGCQNLTSISGISNWNVSSATNMNAMFYSTKNVTDASSLENWPVSKKATYNNMFKIPYSKPKSLPAFKINGIEGTWNDTDGTWTPPT